MEIFLGCHQLIPGYLEIIPYRNCTSTQFIDYLERLQQYERHNNLPITKTVSDFLKFNFPDSILAIAKGLSAVPPPLRNNGTLVSEKIRKVEFEGVSGPIAFDENGDLKSLLFTVASLSDRRIGWTHVGIATPESAQINFNLVCFAVVGCGAGIPEDCPKFKDSLPFWIWVVIATLGIASFLLVFQSRKHRTVADKLRQFEEELKSLESDDDAVKRRKGKLYKESAGLLGQENWTDAHGLVVVPPTQQEYWDVLSRLRATVNEGETCHLSKLYRVQNLGIFSYYVFRKNQLANKYDTDLNI
jgi:Receptor family ligand binding region